MNNDIVPNFDLEANNLLKIQLSVADGIPGCLLLSITGYIDPHDRSSFTKRVFRAIDFGYLYLVFNLAGLRHDSTEGFYCFIEFLRAVKPKGGDVIISEINKSSSEVFSLSGYSQFFIFMPTDQEAIAYYAAQKSKDGRSGS